MIIYHVKPFRDYPDLCTSIQKNFKNNYQFHESYEILNPAEYNPADGVLNYHPCQKTVRQAYSHTPTSSWGLFLENKPKWNGLERVIGAKPFEIDFLYGVFSLDRLLCLKTDILFTIMDHPVVHFYNNFFYLNHLLKKNSSVAKFTGGLLDTNLENFTDTFLDKGLNLTFIWKNKQYKIMDDVFGLRYLEAFKFIGIVDLLPKTLKLLNLTFRSKLSIPQKPPSKLIKKTSYRYNDLEKFFASEIQIYEKAYKDLDKLM